MEGENFSLVGRHLSAPASSSAPNSAVSSRIHLNQFSSASNHHLSNPTSISMISEGLISHPHLVLAPSQLTHLVSQAGVHCLLYDIPPLSPSVYNIHEGGGSYLFILILFFCLLFIIIAAFLQRKIEDCCNSRDSQCK